MAPEVFPSHTVTYLLLAGLVAYQESGESSQFIRGSMDIRLWDAKKQQSKECSELVKQEICHANAIHGQLVAQKQRQAAALAAATDVDSVPIVRKALYNEIVSLSGQKRTLPDATIKSSESVEESVTPDKAATELPDPSKKRFSATTFDLSMPHELPSSHAECECFVNTRVCKHFGTPRTLYFGTVVSFLPPDAATEDDEPLWHILYDDNDDEDFTWAELRRHRKMYAKRRHLDPKHRCKLHYSAPC